MLTMKDIIRDGHPGLRTKAEDVSLPLSTEDRQTIDDMLDFLINSQDDDIAAKYQLRSGVGLAAPQLNINKRMLVIHFFDDKKNNYITHQLINPKIISHSIEKSYLPQGEGCLSVDETIPGLVHRYARITVKGYNPEGKEVKLRLNSFAAIVAQHEIDHLNGVMFYDHINHDDPFKPEPNASPVE
ncbi:peptide deformylase [Macrococcus equipercicus]|uniref:Peptide deformylase n=1 Tax=Macrococcus equipercicus TaxID=69967 RepID=A0A9Q9BWU1_9STAP|nr:peptide deformylase [Macrococcus equipercicus]KAA1042662.1 peptide deformylase [Macrococcus equipercicus]UTH14528.1 peptide deformylase [Macrococcus equipercicus]